jgi:hypothetical protein
MNTFEACSEFTHVTARQAARPTKPRLLSRGFGLASYPAKPPVSYQS